MAGDPRRVTSAAHGRIAVRAEVLLRPHGELGPRLDTGIPVNEDDIVVPRIAQFSTQYSELMPTDFAKRMTPAQLTAVAAFINTVSGDGRGDDSRPDRAALVREGRRVFLSAGCGSCHAVASVHTQGQEGPDFDTSEPLTRAQIRIRLNLGEGGMPSFCDRLTPQQQGRHRVRA